ncbi:hypothetical protein HAD_00715 [Hyphomonas adhaerens MHS-3]|uniref:Uncharacterized protein n=1 Tax=Hyphomonas adhaerens MHS-3 TaxID=1280949 RepID=A0A069E8D2_9PROT|nr:hypothetical protein [Hyphomonas adhaerens]KCZ84156.1 hypothetical protein HAD_00715 [Hyphomonas adhaerens MHS-3]
MAKAHFHKMQRVYVKPVGTWALVEQVIPHWVKDVAEPLKVTYECGLGRPFQASELVSEQAMHGDEPSNHDDDLLLEHWRIGRRSTKWRTAMGHHSGDNSGTFPVVLTDESDVGGWRVNPADFDRDPHRVEHQARMIVQTPDMLRIARRIAEVAAEDPDGFPEELVPVAKQCATILRYVYQLNDPPETVAAE